MNILSFDIEEWFIEKKFNGNRNEKYQEFDRYLKSILEVLGKQKIKATFFCLGKIASEFPDIIRLIYSCGHEIGCHSNEHLWLTKMSPIELRRDTHDAVAALEDIIGDKILSYRAPAFSIGENNKWAIEVLASEGIERDASIFPAQRDFGGFSQFPTDSPTIINYNGITMKEFPICLTSLLGREVAFSGGGYFRFFPYFFVKSRINSSDYVMVYFHIGDLIHDKGGVMSKKNYELYFKETGTLKNRLTRYIKSNIGTKNAFNKMSKLITDYNFISLREADKNIDWKQVRQITL